MKAVPIWCYTINESFNYVCKALPGGPFAFGLDSNHNWMRDRLQEALMDSHDYTVQQLTEVKVNYVFCYLGAIFYA